MEFLSDYGLFLAKTATIVIAVLVILLVAVAVSMRLKAHPGNNIEVTHLNEKYETMANTLRAAILPKKEFKRQIKEQKHKHKAERTRGADEPPPKRVYVLDFKGDIRGSAVSSLREEITAVLTTATANDEVVVRLESAGGMVHSYGLGASQLRRIRDKGIPLTVAVDKVAASGGYLMACVADRILAGPFAIVGSIGVLSQIPNFHRLLKKHDVDFEQFTAGEYKRTVSMFGETTDKAREKLQEEIQDVHLLFKDFVQTQRNQLDLEKVATGEHWHGTRAIEMNLVDEIRTSDDYLMSASDSAELYEVTFEEKKTILDKLSAFMQASLHSGRRLQFPDSGDIDAVRIHTQI
ncbi:MAG: protease SohB [Gammaproteobacteria bacterium]|nr:protease SohB [Gammaproteobacteria bacterium]